MGRRELEFGNNGSVLVCKQVHYARAGGYVWTQREGGVVVTAEVETILTYPYMGSLCDK